MFSNDAFFLDRILEYQMTSINTLFSRRKIVKILAVATFAVSASVLPLSSALSAPGELEKEDLKFAQVNPNQSR